MTKRLWIVAATLAVVVAIGTATAAYVTKPETEEFTRTFTVLEKEAVPGERYGLITTSTTAYHRKWRDIIIMLCILGTIA